MDALIGCLILIVLLYAVKLERQKKKNQEARINNRLVGQADFTASRKIYGCDLRSGIAIDEARKKICLLRQDGNIARARTFSYKDIISSEISQDGSTITKVSRSSQAGSALVGAVLLGGVGAVIGGLSAKKTSTEKISHVSLRIIINYINNPLHEVTFLNSESDKNGHSYQSAMKEARFWNGLIDVLIKTADIDDAKVETYPPKHKELEGEINNTAVMSVADEIKKLADLHQAGHLTSDEFQYQKAKLLKLI